MATACGWAPSREEALVALRRASPGLDGSPVIVRIWADGPPWFSCAEVLAKINSDADHAVVRDAVGRWRSLVLAEYVTLRDTAAGVVTDPGWCVASLRDTSARAAARWRPVRGDTLPNGLYRRGWEVSAGLREIVLTENPTIVGRDSARADYVFTVRVGADGYAIGAQRDTLRREALLIKRNGEWEMARIDTTH